MTLPLPWEYKDEDYLPYAELNLYNEIMKPRRNIKGIEDK